MPLFVPHKTLIEIMWYGGMEIKEIDGTLVNYHYNRMPEEIYKEIIADKEKIPAWKSKHKQNRVIYNFNNRQNYGLRLDEAHYDPKDFDRYYNPGAVHDIMTYLTGAQRTNDGLGTTKMLKVFTTDKLRKFVEMSLLAGLSAESIRQYLALLEPNYGLWSLRVVMSYIKTFWDATRLTLLDNSIRIDDIRAYFNLDKDNRYYDVYVSHLGSLDDELLKYFGLADYGAIQRSNRSLHGKIGGKIMDYFEDKTRRIIPSDYIKLFVHLDSAINDQEAQDKGVEAYRTELQRIFSRLEYVKDNYLSMDELTDKFITQDPNIETDEPYIKGE